MQPMSATKKTNECNSVKYQHRKCKEYNHLQMARCVHSEDDAKVSTTTQSIHRTRITVACQ
jgi:hypothetical protein